MLFKVPGAALALSGNSLLIVLMVISKPFIGSIESE